MKVGELVRFRSLHSAHREWLGLIVREIPGTDERKVVTWTHKNKGTDHGSYRAIDLELVKND